ncbi:hypothetical protein SESBI_32011 [Sesbania bispinosa]|nr:hypothetical protein SESBI_32011 [Sesbania bispinosa]
MTWTHGALWAYDADREGIRYRGWLNLLIYHPSRHRAAAPLPFRIPLELTFSVPPGVVYLRFVLGLFLVQDTQAILNLMWGILRTKKRTLRKRKKPENEPVARSDDAVVPNVGSGGPEDP